MWLPLATSFLWLFASYEVHHEVLHRHDGNNLQVLPWLVISAVCLVITWSGYNHVQYGQKGRRSGAPALSQREKAKGFGITSQSALEQLRERRIWLGFDSDGNIVRIESSNLLLEPIDDAKELTYQ